MNAIQTKFECSKCTFPFEKAKNEGKINTIKKEKNNISTNNINKKNEIINNQAKSSSSTTTIISNNNNIKNAIETLQNIPEKFTNKLEKAVSDLLEAASDDANDWQQLFDSSGVVGKKRDNNNESSVIYVRGDSFLPFNAIDVFKVIVWFDKLSELEPNREITEYLTFYSSNSSMQYLKYKPVYIFFIKFYYYFYSYYGCMMYTVYSVHFFCFCFGLLTKTKKRI